MSNLDFLFFYLFTTITIDESAPGIKAILNFKAPFQRLGNVRGFVFNAYSIINLSAFYVKFLLVTLGSNYSLSYLIVLMDVSETCSNGVTGSLNFETMSYRQQQNQRQRDRRNRLRIGCNDRRKRINDPMSSEINNSNIERIHQSIMHHDFEASTSNQETHDISNSALRSSFNVLNIPTT
ncbi:uncharacterized protein LOC111376896 [Olea europaea var. sylvestris]|uniref:uncharacterized protein LOC111376896 n=1 Tax=Olea europaea var. sylvestris TaxID=158386 RepID=UPI000C1CF0C6|nr:uncharacterized protein LOC111376896 [Olea europaea var. sylvestris]